MKTISICIPTYNRYQLTIDSFAQVMNDNRVEEIILSDDASDNGAYEALVNYFSGNDKVTVHRNEKNLDCYFNKNEAVKKSNNEWAALWDSDNVFGKDYLDAIFSIPEWDDKTIYQPSFAKPHFNFTQWEGLTITKENVSQYADTQLMTSLNAMNFFINRNEYLKVWDGNVNPGSSDSIYFSLCWLKSGNSILITPGLEYYHHIHQDKSNHYNQNAHKYVEFHNQIMNEIKNLK